MGELGPDQLKALRLRFNGQMTVDEAREILRQAGSDQALPGGARLEAVSALLDLNTGRSVQSTMARFRRAVGIDPERAPRGG